VTAHPLFVKDAAVGPPRLAGPTNLPIAMEHDIGDIRGNCSAKQTNGRLQKRASPAGRLQSEQRSL
jgi:hypothetical protein